LIRIGISGWRYEPWRRVWYPEGLPQRRELEFCGRHFPTVEINGSFYALQRRQSYEGRYRDTPTGFVFPVKGSRYLTHMLRLTKVEKPLANFFASGIFALREKLGPFLWQFPPMFVYRRDRLERFFSILPRTTQTRWRLCAGATHACSAGRAWRSTPTVRCPTRSRSGIGASSTTTSSRSCQTMASGSWWPTPPENGRRCSTSLRISCTCGCTAT
jgi:uncharacterized protein YecE (DUF72 family)